MVSASFTSKGKFFKALVDASKVVETNFIEFTRNMVKIVSADPSRYIMLNARVTPPDYRCDADSVWVEATELDAIAKKLKPKDNYKVEIRDSEFYVGHFKVGKVVNVEDVSQVEADRDALANLEKSDSAGFLKVVFPGFRRIVKDAEKTKIPDSFRDKYEYVGFKIEDRKGAIVFYYDKDHFGAPIDFQTYPEWLVDSGGKAEAVYKLDLVSSMMRLGLGDLVTLDIRTGKLLRVNYFGDYWNIDFWVGSYAVEEGVEDLEAILAKPKPKRNLAWSTEGTVLKDFVKVMKAIASVVYGNVNIGISGDDLLVYWQNGATCLFRMPYRHFEEFDRAQHFIGQIDISELTGFLRSVENLKCYVEGEPAESLVFVGSGKNIAEKEYKSEKLVEKVNVPDTGGTSVFSGETKTLQSIFEDALVAEDEFLVFIASDFEINVIGRNNIYYTANLPLDGFQTQNEDYVATTQLDVLKNILYYLPAKKATIGKDENNITVEAETTLGPLKAKIFQVKEDILPAIQAYEEYHKLPVAPEAKPLPEKARASITAYWKPSPRGLSAFWVEVREDGKLRIRGHREVRRETEEELKRMIEEKLQNAVIEAGFPEDALVAERLELVNTLLESVPADVSPITELTQEEFYKRFDGAMDKWLPYAIEQHKSGLAGNLHYDAPQFEEETLAKFTPKGVRERYKTDLKEQREGSWQYYSQSAPKVAAHYLKSIPDVARALAYSWTVKLMRELLSAATEKAKAAAAAPAEERARAIVLDEIKKEIKKSHMEPQAVYSLIRVYVKDKGVDEPTLRKVLEDLMRAGEIIEYAPGLYKIPEEKPVKPEPKFTKGQKVLYQGYIYEVTDMELKDGVWNYELSAPGQSLYKPETNILPYPKEQRLEIANRIRNEQVRIISEPTFKGYLDTVLFNLLKQEGMSLREYQMLHPELPEPEHEYKTPAPSEITAAPSKEIKEVVEEEPIPEEPEQTVYVKVHVEGGVEADQKGKPRIVTPEFVVMCTTYEVFAEHGSNWKADMWSRPLVGMFGVKLLDEVLKEGQIEYNAVEDNQMTWGDDWASIREALSQNPPPFNKYAKFIVKWRPEDVTWTETARQAYDIYKHKYTREELSPLRKKQLQIIAKIKDLSTSGDEQALIGTIVAADAYREEIKEAEEEVPEWKVYKPTPTETPRFKEGHLVRHFGSNLTQTITKRQWNPQDKEWFYQVDNEEGWWRERSLRLPPQGETIWIYNPTYGSLQEKALGETLDESSVWEQSYVAWGRALKESEKKSLLETGVMGKYPEKFFLVGPKFNLTMNMVRTHQRTVEAFEETNRQGEAYAWKDTEGNQREKVAVSFVPGPEVDIINNNPDETAIQSLVDSMLSRASSKYKKQKQFLEACTRHARRLIAAVRAVAPYPTMKDKFPWVQKREAVKAPVKSEAEKLAEEALKEIAGDALSELEGL